MKKLLAFAFYSLVVLLFASCGNDNAKVVEYLNHVYFQQHIDRGDKVPTITIVKTKNIKAYNPMLDTNSQNVVAWASTSLRKITDAINSGNAFDVLVDEFGTDDANCNATVVEFTFTNNKEHFFNILFKKNGEYYDSFENVGKYAAKVLYEQRKSEALQ